MFLSDWANWSTATLVNWTVWLTSWIDFWRFLLLVLKKAEVVLNSSMSVVIFFVLVLIFERFCMIYWVVLFSYVKFLEIDLVSFLNFSFDRFSLLANWENSSNLLFHSFIVQLKSLKIFFHYFTVSESESTVFSISSILSSKTLIL